MPRSLSTVSGRKIKSLTIYVIQASQFSAKVLTALDAREIPYFVKIVTAQQLMKGKLPSGRKMVPEMVVLYEQDNPGGGGEIVTTVDSSENETSVANLLKAITVDTTGLDEAMGMASCRPDMFAHQVSDKTIITKDGEIVPDSDAILAWFDNNLADFPHKFYPEDSLNEAFSIELDLYGMYYTWVFPPTWERGMQKYILSLMPRILKCKCVVNYIMRTKRQDTKERIKNVLRKTEEDVATQSEPQFRREYIAFLVKHCKLLTEGTQGLLAHPIVKDKLTAKHFTLYAMLDRSVGTMGDVGFICSLPELKDEPSLKPLFAWHAAMQKEVPIRFYGKEAPKEKE